MKKIIQAAVVASFAVMTLTGQPLPPANGAAPADAPAAAAAPAGPSKEEVEAVQKIQQATDPDARMKASDEFALKFPTSNLRGYVFTMAGEAAQNKRDAGKAKFYYEEAIKADPNSDYAMIMLGFEIAQGVGENDLDKKPKLDQAQAYVDKGMDLVSKRTKEPNETPQQFEESKKDDMARGHMALGMIKMGNKQDAEAGKEFLLAADGAHPDVMNLIRAGMAFNNAKQFDEANKALDKFIAFPGMPDQYKKIAEDEKKRGQQLKSQK